MIDGRANDAEFGELIAWLKTNGLEGRSVWRLSRLEVAQRRVKRRLYVDCSSASENKPCVLRRRK